MSILNVLQYALFLGIVLALVKPVGRYLERVFAGERTFLDPVMRPMVGRFGLAVPALVLGPIVEHLRL